MIGCALALAGLGFAQAKFEVASIKPCKADVYPEGGRGGGHGSLSPGTLTLECHTVRSLIQMAYILFENGKIHPWTSIPIDGGPAWINSERYTINAKAEGSASQTTMSGPMLAGLLEDRLQVKVHRETREVPVYFLTIAKGGLKLKPFEEGTCTPMDLDFFFSKFPPPDLPEPPAGQRYCLNRGRSKGINNVLEAEAMSIDLFVQSYLRLDRPVIDKTGLAGRFNFYLEYAPEEAPTDDPGAAAPLFTALQQQLGLKLESGKGPGEYLVIDRVERPSGN
jgi:uncharacterized protein (TIGR03435 family)